MKRWYLKPALIGSVALFSLWLVLVRGYADYMARVESARALSIHAQHPEALIRLAEAALIEERSEDARALATRAAGIAPLEGRAFRILGAIADLEGKNDEAAALMDVAAKLAPRDASTQFWLVLSAIKERDVEEALRRMDRLMRFQPETHREMLPLLLTIASNPAGAEPLARVLAASPPWRSQFFYHLTWASPTSTHLAMFVNALRRAGVVLTDYERDSWIRRLTSERDWPRLKRALREYELANPSVLSNGDFEGDREGPFGGWLLGKVSGIEMQIEAKPGLPTDRALRVEFFDRRERLERPEQWTFLDPGSYRFSGKVHLDELEAARGLSWSIGCVPSGATALVTSELFVGTREWSPFSMEFQVPPENCDAQSIHLEISARIAAELQVRGVAWFDDLTIVRLDPPSPTTQN